MTMRGAWFLALCTLIGYFLNGQNLVINPGFEAPRPCPRTYNTRPVKEVVPGWFSRDVGTPDYYHRCSDGDVGVPMNWVSIAEPVSGDAYLGFYVFRGKYREILQAKLSEPLIRDTTYLVGAWINHGSASAYQVKALNVTLEPSLVDFDVKWTPSRSLKLLRWGVNKPEQLGWKQMQLEYKAMGVEQFLLIGALEPVIQQTAIHWPWNKAYRDEPQMDHAAYYFLDDVYVKPKYQAAKDTADRFYDPTHSFVLEDINFQFDRHDLNDAARILLTDWFAQIEISNVDRVVVSGHTDDVGSDAYNLRLSQRRGDAVKSCLMNLGWPAELIEVQAFGETQPMTPNDSPASQSRNRRVVIDIYELGQF